MSTPRNHHYVSQVLIRKFLDNTNTLYSYDKTTKIFSQSQSTKRTFSERDLNSTINENGEIEHESVEKNLHAYFEKNFNEHYNRIVAASESYYTVESVNAKELNKSLKYLIRMGIIGEMRNPVHQKERNEGIFGLLRMLANNSVEELKQSTLQHESGVSKVKNKIPIDYKKISDQVLKLMGNNIYSIFIAPESEYFLLPDCTAAVYRTNLLKDYIYDGQILKSEGKSIANVIFPINRKIIIVATSTKIFPKKPNGIYSLSKEVTKDYNKLLLNKAYKKVICSNKEYLKEFINNIEENKT